MIRRRPKIAICVFRGNVGASSRFPGTFTADDAILQLQEVCAGHPPEVLVLCINCTGGSPAQAELICRYVAQIREQLGSRTIAFVEDFATSAGFWIASSCDEIYALETSLIGSVGIMTKTFDVSGLLDKVGVKRKVYSTADAKTDLDIFQPHSTASIERSKQVNAALEKTFLRKIEQSRGTRLEVSLDVLSSGEIWTGADALDHGCIDGIASLQTFFEADEFRLHKFVYAKPAKQSLISRIIGLK